MPLKRSARTLKPSKRTDLSSSLDKYRLIRQQQVITGDVAAQTDRVLRNLSEILEAAGSGLGKVVRCGVFLKSMNDFAAMNQVYGKYFSSAPPARSTVEVSRLPKDVLVEIDVIAVE
jgi:2-iminobutanoate/2-iminopropanoate deaminase